MKEHPALKGIRVGVDRIKVGLVFDSPKSPEFVQLMEWVKSVKYKDFSLAGSVSTPHAASSLTSVNQPLVNGGSIFVRYGFCQQKYRAWVHFNPNKTHMAEMIGHLTLILDHGFLSLFQRGVVTSCEFAIDVDGAQFSDYLFLDSSLRSGSDSYVKVGTQYIGSSQGDRSFTLYDKAKEVLAKQKIQLESERLRLEGKLRGKRRFPMSGLFEIPNLFETLMVIDRQALTASPLIELGPLRAALGSTAGCAQAAYTCLPRSVRTSTKHALLTLQPSWWVPAKIWQAYPPSLSWVKEALGTA